MPPAKLYHHNTYLSCLIYPSRYAVRVTVKRAVLRPSAEGRANLLDMTLIQALDALFDDMRQYLVYMDDAAYAEPLDVLSGSSTGQHTRHIIEFFQCLLAQRGEGLIDYDCRVRDLAIESNTAVAQDALLAVANGIREANPKEVLHLQVGYDPQQMITNRVDTTFERELVYNIEHAIHHMAMIKIALRMVVPEFPIPRAFGVAPSTIHYQDQQATAG